MLIKVNTCNTGPLFRKNWFSLILKVLLDGHPIFWKVGGLLFVEHRPGALSPELLLHSWAVDVDCGAYCCLSFEGPLHLTQVQHDIICTCLRLSLSCHFKFSFLCLRSSAEYLIILGLDRGFAHLRLGSLLSEWQLVYFEKLGLNHFESFVLVEHWHFMIMWRLYGFLKLLTYIPSFNILIG